LLVCSGAAEDPQHVFGGGVSVKNESLDDPVADIVRRTLAYAAGVLEADITETTRISDLGIDSVATMTSGVVLEAELGIAIDRDDLVALFSAGNVNEAIDVAKELVANGGRREPVTSLNKG
jgi:acyl carrier protein